MPIVNTRNAQARTMQATDFVQRQDHFVGVMSLAALARSAPGLIDSWIMSPIARDAANHPYYPGLVEPALWTNNTNTIAALTNPAANIFRHGLIGSSRLGEVSTRSLFADASLHNSRTITEGWSTTQGLWCMAGLWVPAGALAPTAVTLYKTIMAKWTFDADPANYEWSWWLSWRFVAGWVPTTTPVSVRFSETGNTSVTFDSLLTLTPGSYHIVGFILRPAVDVTIFVDNNYSTRVAPDVVFGVHPNRVPIALNPAGNTPLTIARLQVITAGTNPFPSMDAYYHFAMYGHAALTIEQWLSMYHLIKPALGYNTNLGGV